MKPKKNSYHTSVGLKVDELKVDEFLICQIVAQGQIIAILQHLVFFIMH